MISLVKDIELVNSINEDAYKIGFCGNCNISLREDINPKVCPNEKCCVELCWDFYD